MDDQDKYDSDIPKVAVSSRHQQRGATTVKKLEGEITQEVMRYGAIIDRLISMAGRLEDRLLPIARKDGVEASSELNNEKQTRNTEMGSILSAHNDTLLVTVNRLEDLLDKVDL